MSTLPVVARVALVFGAAGAPTVALVVWWAHWAAGQFSTPWMLVQMVVVLGIVASWVLLVVNVSFRWLVRGRAKP